MKDPGGVMNEPIVVLFSQGLSIIQVLINDPSPAPVTTNNITSMRWTNTLFRIINSPLWWINLLHYEWNNSYAEKAHCYKGLNDYCDE